MRGDLDLRKLSRITLAVADGLARKTHAGGDDDLAQRYSALRTALSIIDRTLGGGRAVPPGTVGALGRISADLSLRSRPEKRTGQLVQLFDGAYRLAASLSERGLAYRRRRAALQSIALGAAALGIAAGLAVVVIRRPSWAAWRSRFT